MTEFTIHLTNRPGQLAGLIKVMTDAGVEIEALAAFGLEDLGVVRMVVADAGTARRAQPARAASLAEGGSREPALQRDREGP